MAQHAKLSPSSAERWLNCAGSVRMCEGLPRKPTNVYAMSGSIMHKVGQVCLDKNLNADYFLNWYGYYNHGEVELINERGPVRPAGANLHMSKIDEKDVAAIQIYIDEVRSKRTAIPGAKYETEKRLDLNWLVPGMFGTGDSVIVEPYVKIWIDDYKNGFSIVEVGTHENPNPQFMLYGIGAIGNGNPFNVSQITMTVIQPNALHPEGPVRSLTLTLDQVKVWIKDVLRPGVLLVQNPNAPLVVGPWCKWCEANSPLICPMIKEEIVATTQLSIEDMFGQKQIHTPAQIEDLFPAYPVDPVNLTGEQLDRILNFKPIIEEWFGNCKAEAERRLLNRLPEAPLQFKMVQGNRQKSWAKSVDEIVLSLQQHVEDPYDLYQDPVLRSPAQMIELFRSRGMTAKAAEEFLSTYFNINRPVTMVTADDKRPAYTSVEAMFGGQEFNPFA